MAQAGTPPARADRGNSLGACFALAALIGSFALSGYGAPSQAVPKNLLSATSLDAMTYARNGERMTDGIAAAAGAPWNSELAARLDNGGSVQWDLGRVERLARALIQADNNDAYALVVSQDGEHWSTAWEAAALGETGLRTRETRAIDAVARYVRLEPRGGDGHYSVSELIVAGPSASTWPPKLAQRDGGSIEHPLHPGLLPRVLLALAMALLLLPWSARAHEGAAPARAALAWVALGLCAFVVVTALGYAAQNRFNLVDDAYISLQYAKNWASGAGLVFNPGERVEGYTNFLWVALIAPLWPLSGRDPELMARAATWLALAFALLGLILIAAIGRRVFSRTLLATAFALLLCAFDDAYVSYPVVFALENHLLVALTLGGVALLVYRPPGFELALGASFALVVMTRPDGVLWPAAFFTVHALALVRGRGRDPSADGVGLGALGRIFAAFVVPFGLYFAWRVFYFGDLLPNTFYLKVGDGFGAVARGLGYLRSYVLDRFGVPLLAPLALFIVRAAWARWLLLHALLHCAYVVYVGGDFYPGHRFLLVLTPGLALLAASVLDHAISLARGRRALVLAATAGAVLACLAVRFGTLRDGPYATDLHGATLPFVDNNVKYMQWLKRAARPDATMVVGDIGATGLFADVRVIDVFGVVDRKVARKRVASFGTGKAGHEKVASREEQLERRPTYIKWGYVGDSRPPPGYYIFNAFPPHLRVEGLWVKDDQSRGRLLARNNWHMNPHELRAWTRSGDAFADPPARGAVAGQAPINGHRGHLLNSFNAGFGDASTGSLLSPTFTLEGNCLRLLVGGGRDPERLRVSLLVDGRRAFTETGSNWETLGRREWDISALRGKTAQLEIVDNATGVWGHILVDEVESWELSSAASDRL